MKLHPYIQVGRCLSYGDADYSVSMEVCGLSREKWDAIKLMTLAALDEGERAWQRENAQHGYQEMKP